MENTNYTLDQVFATEEDMNLNINKIEEGHLAYVTASKKMFIKKEGVFENFMPQDIAPRETNSMIIKFATYEDFVGNLSSIPAGSKVYIEDTDTIWENNDGSFDFLGKAEALGIKIIK
jgi:hypothetical protein